VDVIIPGIIFMSIIIIMTHLRSKFKCYWVGKIPSKS